MGITTVGAEQVRAHVTMPAAIAAVREAFLGLRAGDFEMPTRTALRDGQFLDMAVHHRPSGTAAFKTLSLDFTGRQPAIVGTIAWHSLHDTEPLVADAATLTTIRTGAVSGVATDLLAGPDARTCVVLGTGAQAPDQVRAVLAVRDVERVTFVGRTRAGADRLVLHLADELVGVHLVAVAYDDPAYRSALGEADVVCCATPATEPLFALADLPERVHVNAIGSFRPTMRELPDDLLADGLVVVDEREAALEEAGELIHAIDAGRLRPEALVELGDALALGVPESRRTTFKSVGVAIQDWAVLRLLSSAVREG